MTAAWSALTKRWAAAALGIVAVVATGCGDDQAAFEVDDGALRGTLAVYISDYHGRAQRDPLLPARRKRRGAAAAVRFAARCRAGRPASRCGTLAPGRRPAGDVVRELAAACHRRRRRWSPRRRSRRAASPSCWSTSANGVNVTAETMKDRLINNPDSIRNYYLGDSYGMQDMTAEVFGPISVHAARLRQRGHLAPRAQPASDGPGDVPALPLVLRQPDLAVRLERPRVAGDAGHAVARHLVQRLDQLRGAGAGARAQLRNAALVVALLRRRAVRGQSQRTAPPASTATPSIRWAAAAVT